MSYEDHWHDCKGCQDDKGCRYTNLKEEKSNTHFQVFQDARYVCECAINQDHYENGDIYQYKSEPVEGFKKIESHYRIHPNKKSLCYCNIGKDHQYGARAKEEKTQADNEENALRYNDGKTRYSLVPPEWVDWIANIFEKGAQKYAPHNWKKSRGTKDHNAFVTDREDSLMRHLQAYRRGEWKDPETELPHLGHVAWNALCIVWYGGCNQ